MYTMIIYVQTSDQVTNNYLKVVEAYTCSANTLHLIWWSLKYLQTKITTNISTVIWYTVNNMN